MAPVQCIEAYNGEQETRKGSDEEMNRFFDFAVRHGRASTRTPQGEELPPSVSGREMEPSANDARGMRAAHTRDL